MDNYIVIGEYPEIHIDTSFRDDVKILGYYHNRHEAQKALEEFEKQGFDMLQIEHLKDY